MTAAASPTVAAGGRVAVQGSWGRRTALVAAGQSAVKGGQLVVAVVLVRALTPDEWTRVAYLLSIHLAAVTLGTGNLQHGLVFFLPRTDPALQRGLVVRTAALLAGGGVAIGVGIAALAPWISGGVLDVRSLLPWLGVAIALELPTACAPAALVGTGEVRLAAGWDASVTAVMLACVLGPAALGLGAGGVVAGLAAQALARAAAFAGLVVWRFRGPWRAPAIVTARTQLRHGLPLGLTLAASVLNRTVDKWFVAAFDAGKVGVHAIAAQEVPLLAVLPYAGGAVTAASLVEAFRERDLHTATALWLRQTAAMSRVVVPVAVGLVMVAPEVFDLLLPPRYALGVLAFQLFTAVTVHRVAEYGLVLRAAGRNGDVLRSALILLAANALLAFAGAWGWGMTGAAVGTLLANVVAWWYVIGRIGRTLELPWTRAFPWAAWSLSLSAAIGAAFVARAATAAVDRPASRLVASTLAYAALVLAAGRVATRRVGAAR